jgi:hypothetical protein
MQRIEAGRAHCAICSEVIRPFEEALVTSDFLADEADPLWRFNDAPMHRACFLVWDLRKEFIARYNRAARQLAARDGSYPRMTSEGDIVHDLPGVPWPS